MLHSARAVYVDTGDRRIFAKVHSTRPRHRILELEDGRMAKIVIGSSAVSSGDTQDEIAHLCTMRNREVWRFLRKQSHPGLLRVHERVVDEWGDEGFICERLEVDELTGTPHRRITTLESFLRICQILATAAGHLHTKGIIHGDITPSNVGFRGSDPVLIDFELWIRTCGFSKRTQGKGRFSCTPWCASPEQILLDPITDASDVYCLALTMLSWVSGRFGVKGAMPNQTMVHSMIFCSRAMYPHWELVDARIGNASVIDVFCRALFPCPYDRYENGYAFARALEDCLAQLSEEERRRPLQPKPYEPPLMDLDEAEAVTVDLGLL